MNKTNISDYNSDSIQVLDDINHIRKRKGMYIGDANDPRQLISEIIDNSIDEVQGGFSDKLVVTVDTKKNSYMVRDYGRGIPHGTKKLDNGEEKEVIEVLCTKSNSGGKFDNKSYNYSSGLHGLGLTITNALSDWIEIKSFRDGICAHLKAINGKIELLEKVNTNEPNGTELSFSPSKRYFSNNKIPLQFIENRCKISSALGFISELIVDGKQIDTNSTIFDLMLEDSKNISNYYDFEIFDITTNNGERMKVAMRYTSDTTDRYFGFTNLLVNSIGGTHISELSKTIHETWRELINKHKNLRPDVELRNSDYLIGLRAVCAVFISNPEFSSQTKEKLVNNKSYFKDLMLEFKKSLMKSLGSDINRTKSLIKRFEEYRISQNKLLSRKEISSIIKVNKDSPDNIRRKSVVPKLRECISKSREDTELIICEGDSAASPLIRTRNKFTQAVLPLRGRILNVTNMDPKQAIKSQEVCNIVNAIGCGIGSQCDASRSRYSRIVYMSDEDSDGMGIVNLVLSVFVNMLPDIVKNGMLYLSKSPLYTWQINKEPFGCNDIGEIPAGVKYSRIKGLGEFDDIEVKKFLINPETRTLYQIEYPSDIQKFNYIMGTSQGKGSLLKDLGLIVKRD